MLGCVVFCVHAQQLAIAKSEMESNKDSLTQATRSTLAFRRCMDLLVALRACIGNLPVFWCSLAAAVAGAATTQ